VLQRDKLVTVARKVDWAALEASEAAWWTGVSPAEKIRIADELRKQAIATHEGWPSEEDRKSDLETHARVAALLRKTSRVPVRAPRRARSRSR
jgi:hypothetical protein